MKGSNYFPGVSFFLILIFYRNCSKSASMSRKTDHRSKLLIQVINVAKIESYDHGLPSLPTQNPYSKLGH